MRDAKSTTVVLKELCISDGEANLIPPHHRALLRTLLELALLRGLRVSRLPVANLQ